MLIYNRFGAYQVELYKTSEIKIAITELRTYEIRFTNKELHDLETLLESDDNDALQNRWNLLVYAEFCKQRGIPVEDELVNLYSLEEGEYELYEECPCGSEPIFGLFEESTDVPLTEFELEILERSVFEFAGVSDAGLANANTQTRGIIMNKKIPRV